MPFDLQTVQAIAAYLFPDTILIPAARSEPYRRVERRIISLTDDQYQLLAAADESERCLFQGAAGISKIPVPETYLNTVAGPLPSYEFWRDDAELRILLDRAVRGYINNAENPAKYLRWAPVRSQNPAWICWSIPTTTTPCMTAPAFTGCRLPPATKFLAVRLALTTTPTLNSARCAVSRGWRARSSF